MRKKFVVTAMLLLTFALSSCVDNKESVSVEAIRMAKAKQLESVSAMNMAEAEATRLLAEANAALKNAEAEAQKILNDEAKAKLAIEMAGQEQKLQEALLNAQIKLAEAKTNLEKALKEADEATRKRITELSDNYYNAVTDLNALKGTLYTEKNELIGLENGLISIERLFVDNVAAQNRIIAANTSKIEIYKSDTNYKELEKALKASDENLVILRAKQVSAELEVKVADKTKYDKKHAAEESVYRTVAENYGECIIFGQAKGFFLKYTYSDGNRDEQDYVQYPYAKVNLTLFEMTVLNMEADFISKEDIYNKAQQKAVDSKVTADAAEKAWKEAQGDDKIAKEALYKAAKKTYETDVTAVETARINMVVARQDLDECKEDFILLTNTGVSDYNKLIDDLNAACKSTAQFEIELSKAEWEVEREEGINKALRKILEGYIDDYDDFVPGIDLNAYIKDCEDEIAAAKIKISELELARGNEDALIAYKKDEIAATESKILAAQANVKLAKAALDAAMATK